MKRLKDLQKEMQLKVKTLRDRPEEMMKVQKEAMKVNFEYMKHSFKPTLITMLPMILILGWMAGHLSYEQIYPGESYGVTAEFVKGISGQAELVADEGTELISPAQQEILDGKATWNLKSTAGSHLLTVKQEKTEQSRKVLITQELQYEEAITMFQHSDIQKITVNYNKLRPLGADFSIFGWQPGWLGIYLILSIIFSMVLRKLMKIY